MNFTQIKNRTNKGEIPMPIQPKFQIGRKKRQYVANKQFTNREGPRTVFSKTLQTIKSRTVKDQDIDVIMYYGVGGIGKSSLQKQLKLDLVEQESNALHTTLDFKDHTLHAPARALLELTKAIKYEQKVSFPHFEIAYSIYFYKRNPDIAFNEKKLPFGQELDILGSFLGTIDGLGIVQTVSGIVGKIYDTKKHWSLNPEAKEQLKELEHCTVQEIEEQLVGFFAYDLQQAIEKNDIQSTVIFLDTFEALWSDVSNKTIVHTKDEWVRDLIVSLPNVLFVICGRESLEWEKYNEAWTHILNHHLIENLANNDAETFLKNCGIEETDIRNKMITSSNGYPYHLDLSVDTYFEMKNRGEVIDKGKFGSNPREILDRFLQYLTDYEIETLKIMSIPRFYNREIFTTLLTNHPTGYSITKYEDFNKFSFITEERGKYFINKLMRQSMVEHSSENLLKSVHETMANYYDEKLVSQTKVTINEGKKMQILSELIFHRKAYLNKDAFVKWLSVDYLWLLKSWQLRGETRFLRGILSELYIEFGAKDLGISFMQILIDMVHLNGEYGSAIAMIDAYFDEMNTKEILQSKETTQLAIRKVHHQMFLVPVDPLIKQLLEYETTLSTKGWTTEYNELLFMIGGNLGVLSGDMAFSRKWLTRSIRYAEKTKQNNYLCRALRKYTDILTIYGHLKWAKECCNRGINIANENGYERYEAVLVCTLANIYRMEQQYELAEETLRDAMKMIKKVGIKGWEGHIHAIYAEMYYQQGDYQKSASKWQEALETYVAIDQKWGLIVGNIGLESCRIKGVLTDQQEPIEYWLQEAKRLNYRREKEIGEQIIKGDTRIIPMAFL